MAGFEKAWYYDKMHLGLVHEITKGEGIVIGVLDTGVDKHHVELEDNILSTKDFTGEGYGRINPHASHVAGIIVGNKKMTGVAPDAKIRDYKVLQSNGSGTSKAVSGAITQAVVDGCDILNLSLGSDGLSPQIKNAIEYATARGVIVICAAGNDAKDIDYPAAFPETIAVAALDYKANWIMADFSSPSIGKKVVDISAPGVNILSSVPNGRYARYSGTSMATPVVSGIVALLLSAKKPDRSKVREILTSTAIDLENKGFSEKSGWGVVNPAKIFGIDTTNKIVKKARSLWDRIASFFKILKFW